MMFVRMASLEYKESEYRLDHLKKVKVALKQKKEEIRLDFTHTLHTLHTKTQSENSHFISTSPIMPLIRHAAKALMSSWALAAPAASTQATEVFVRHMGTERRPGESGAWTSGLMRI